MARYSPWCCAGESYVHFEDVSSALMEEMKGKFVTVAPQTDPSLEFPTSAYLISNGMTLQFRHDGNQTWENETAGTLHPYLYLAYSSYPINYPPNEPATASTYYSIGANRDSAIYNAHTNQDGPAVFRIYADECPFPPSPPPPPPTVAMCHEGYWPLYMTEAEAVAVSPLGHGETCTPSRASTSTCPTALTARCTPRTTRRGARGTPRRCRPSRRPRPRTRRARRRPCRRPPRPRPTRCRCRCKWCS